MTARPRPTVASLVLGGWQPTAAHIRAVTLAAGAALVAALARRPDLLVLAAPLAVAAVWGQLRRPTGVLTAKARVTQPTLREGEVTALAAVIESGGEGRAEGGVADLEGVVALARTPWLDRQPPSGVAWLEDGQATLGLRTMRWGRRDIGRVAISVTSVWGAYRTGPEELPPMGTTTLPVPAAFDARAPSPHPRGLLGQNRSSRPGSGTEFNTIRPFHPGDRLRRIHWPVSLRTGQLHVTSTYADEDALVVLLVDAFSDLGPREGIDGRPTSLDVTVRAAGAVAEHFLTSGDRLTLRAVGATDVPTLGVGTGKRNLRRVLETLAIIAPATDRRDDGQRSIRGLDPMALALVFTPLVEPRMVQLAHTLASRGMTTIVVDTFPSHLTDNPDDVHQALAWRIRLLAREAQLASLRTRGVPIVPWHGPGSLDHVLRDLARRAGAPRMVRR